MLRRKILIGLFLSLLLINIVVMPAISDVGDNIEFDAIKAILNTKGAAEFLSNFGIPKEVTRSEWGIIYLLVPLITYALVLKAILVDEIIVTTMGVRTFEGTYGWVFVLLVLIFLIPTGILGMTAMWIYASAGIMVIYGFGALLLMNVVKRFFKDKNRFAGAFVIVVLGVIASFTWPQWGWIVGVIGFGLVFFDVVSFAQVKLQLGQSPSKTSRTEEQEISQFIIRESEALLKRYDLEEGVEENIRIEARRKAREAIFGKFSMKSARAYITNLQKKLNDAAKLKTI